MTAFHPDYKMTDRGATPVETLLRACEIGTAEGLRYVYAGNIPGRVGQWENTRCPACGETVIERRGFRVRPQPAGRRCLPEMRDADSGALGRLGRRGRRERTGYRCR